jgi:hypothetical protein
MRILLRLPRAPMAGTETPASFQKALAMASAGGRQWRCVIVAEICPARRASVNQSPPFTARRNDLGCGRAMGVSFPLAAELS